MLVLCGALAVGASLASCGGATPDGLTVVSVDGHSITKATLDHWTAIEAVLAYQLNPSAPVPRGVVPDPPAYVKCIAYLLTTPPTLLKTNSSETVAQLRGQCAERRTQLQRHVLDILITNYWLRGEADARGVAVAEGELREAIDRQFPSEEAFRRFLRLTGETASDDMFVVKGDLLTNKLRQLVTSAQGLTSEQQQLAYARFNDAFAKRWRAQTTCRQGYVVAECREYKGPLKSPVV